MTAKTVLVDVNGMMSLVCPSCGDNSMKPAEHFPIHQPVSMTCSCGMMYEFMIETRKDVRKKTSLKGYYMKGDSIEYFERMTIIDLTLNGCCFLASDKHKLSLGDSITVLFKLDNAARTEIKRTATVRRISGNEIGCQLIRDAYDPDLGFYVKNFKTPR